MLCRIQHPFRALPHCVREPIQSLTPFQYPTHELPPRTHVLGLTRRMMICLPPPRSPPPERQQIRPTAHTATTLRLRRATPQGRETIP